MSSETDNVAPVEQDDTPSVEGEQPPAVQPAHPWEDPESARKEILKLRQESATRRAKLKEVEPLAKKWSEKEQSEKSEAQLLREEVERLKTENASTALEALRNKVVASTGCPAEFVPLLQGTEEEMTATASTLAEKYGQTAAPQNGSRPVPFMRIGQTPPSGKPADIDDFLRQAGRR